MITGVTEITEICTKQDMSRWTRAHADVPGITWSVYPGPGGTMIIVEHEENRCSAGAVAGAASVARPARVSTDATMTDLAAGVSDTAARSSHPFRTRPSHSAPAVA